MPPLKKKAGRPKLPSGHAKAQIVPVRFNPELLKQVTKAAAAKRQTVSEFIRGTLSAALEA
jgi:predicted HicB family RNase H-like nuclease